jgi:uncharacterized membrane protein YraQ (UPF0718 family)/copper chaperone CopZ
MKGSTQLEFITQLWVTMTALAPSLLLGLLVAGLLHVLVSRDKILGHLGSPGFLSSAKAALVGVPLPLCSCGVLPAAISLKRDGASDGAVTSFLISTPQTGVDSIAVTWGVLGLPVALAKVAAAFAAGLLGGTLADVSGKKRPVPKVGSVGCAESDRGSLPRRIWNYSFGTIFRDIYAWIAFGIGISALITIFLQPGELSRYSFLSGPLGLLAALALGIPLYVCSVASVPIAAGLIYAGFPVGSALVFLMAGPATNAATMGAVRKSMGTRVFLIYVFTVILISMATGLLLNSLEIPVAGIASHEHGTGSFLGLLAAVASAAVTLGIAWFGLADLRKLISRLFHSRSDSEYSRKLIIHGMSCGKCEKRVLDALSAVSGLKVQSVSASEGRAVVLVDGPAADIIHKARKAVEDAGYEVKEVE